VDCTQLSGYSHWLRGYYLLEHPIIKLGRSHTSTRRVRTSPGSRTQKELASESVYQVSASSAVRAKQAMQAQNTNQT
jgi:hypothetical protein